jgi:cyclopropane-fatty-acyl-phospholipid synthase
VRTRGRITRTWDTTARALRGGNAAEAFGRALASVADARLRTPRFSVRFWDGSTLPGGGQGSQSPIIVLRSPVALAYLLRQPNQLGLARAWVSGAIDLDGDLEAVLRTRRDYDGVSLSSRERLRLALRAALIGGPRILRAPPTPSIEARPRGARHSLARDRHAVRHHYDVSNGFYRLVLGPSMTYSCAYFTAPDDTLEAAQERKHDLICRKLQLSPGERLLDIGCGWGSLLVHAATRYGVRGLGITLSEPQAQLAHERARDAGVSELLEFRVADYRELIDDPFDKVVSVGMYEHVGRAELGRYVSTVRRLTAPGGLFLNHGIARLASTQGGRDTFINRYIFPDGELHPVAAIISEMQGAGFEVRDVESVREHYPLTLRRWAANLEAHRDEAIADVGEERVRAWRLYILGSALGFEDGEITVYQVLAARLGAPHRLPLNRSELIGDQRAADAEPEVLQHAR